MKIKTPEPGPAGSVPARVRRSVETGVQKGWAGLIWLLKILVPVSFFTALLVHFQLLSYINFLLEPLMSLIHLPASAAVVLVVGLFTGIYGTVAALSVMPFAMDHMILIAVFTLISHNLIQEGLVQARSGIGFFTASAFRLVMAFVVTFACGSIMGEGPEVSGMAGVKASDVGPFLPMLGTWALDTVKLCVEVFCIIMFIMIALELAKTFYLIERVTRAATPLVRFMGLDRSCTMLWMTAAIFGLAYGSAVIMEETRTQPFEKSALTRLHLSIGVNHAMVEDPVLFLPLGLPVLWLWLPRLAAAFIVAWIHLGFTHARRLYA
jgi:hypothetical protein